MAKATPVAAAHPKEEEIAVAFRFLDSFHDTGRLTLATLQKRLAPLLFPATTTATTSSKEHQHAFFHTLMGAASDAEAGVSLEDLKALLLVPPNATPASHFTLGKDKAKDPLATAFGYLDPRNESFVTPAALATVLGAIEGLTLGETDIAALQKAVDKDQDGKIGLKDFKALAAAGGQEDKTKGDKGEYDVQEEMEGEEGQVV